jgi:alpha-glucoside transport system permease protein
VGLVNEVIGLAGVAPVAWLTQEPLVNTVLLASAFAWALAGVVAAVLLATLRSTDRPAPGVAGWWRSLRTALLPTVRRPLVGVAAVVAVLAVRAHDVVRVATDGAFGTQVLSTEALDRALVDGQPGRGAALGIVLLLATGPFVASLLWAARRATARPARRGGRHSRGRARPVERRTAGSPPSDGGPVDARAAVPSVPTRGRLALVGGLVTFVALVPLVGVVVTSLRPAADAASDGWWRIVLDPSLTAENLRTVLGDGPLGGMWSASLDSLAITVPSVLLTLGLALVTVDGLSRLDPAADRRARLLLLALALVPPAAVLPSLAAGLDAVDLLGSPVAPWVVHAALGLPLAALLLRSGPSDPVQATLPWDRIAAVAALQFVLVWTDYVVAASTIGGRDRPMPTSVHLAHLVAARGEELPLVAAAAAVAMVVPVVVVLSMRRALVGLAADPAARAGAAAPGG